MDQLYYRNGAVYVFKRNTLFKQNKILGKKAGYILINERQISIDDINDLKIARKEFGNRLK